MQLPNALTMASASLLLQLLVSCSAFWLQPFLAPLVVWEFEFDFSLIISWTVSGNKENQQGFFEVRAFVGNKR